MEQRFDSIPLGETYFTPEGYLIDNPILTRVGIFDVSQRRRHRSQGTASAGGSFCRRRALQATRASR